MIKYRSFCLFWYLDLTQGWDVSSLYSYVLLLDLRDRLNKIDRSTPWSFVHGHAYSLVYLIEQPRYHFPLFEEDNSHLDQTLPSAWFKTYPSISFMITLLRCNVGQYHSMQSSCRKLWLISGLRINIYHCMKTPMTHHSSKVIHKRIYLILCTPTCVSTWLYWYHISIACKTWLSQQSMCLIITIIGV